MRLRARGEEGAWWTQGIFRNQQVVTLVVKGLTAIYIQLEQSKHKPVEPSPTSNQLFELLMISQKVASAGKIAPCWTAR